MKVKRNVFIVSLPQTEFSDIVHGSSIGDELPFQ
jgi:hypothetical protein